jgi:alpha/beta superfamily hydrolase
MVVFKDNPLEKLIMNHIAIFLSFVCINACYAKPAPQNTFKLGANPMPFAQSEKLSQQIQAIKDKINTLQSSEASNFFIDKLNEFRLQRLNEELVDKSKKQI